MAELCSELSDLISRTDSHVNERVRAERSWLQVALGPAFEKFESCIERFDYESALHLLKDWGRSSGLSEHWLPQSPEIT